MPEIALPTKSTQDSINTNVGTNDDVASPTGSVHAKLKDIRTNLGTDFFKGVPKLYAVRGNTANSTTVTPLNVTGKGFVNQINLGISSADYNTSSAKLTIDGTVVFNTSLQNLQDDLSTSGEKPISIFGPFAFKSSFKLELNTSTNLTYQCKVSYSLH